MKSEKYYLAWLVVTLAVLFGLTALLDVAWIEARVIRQVLVYVLMVFVVYVAYKNLK